VLSGPQKCIGIVVCPLAWAGSRGAPARAAGRGQIDFTRDVLLLQVTPTPFGIPITPVVSPTSPFLQPLS